MAKRVMLAALTLEFACDYVSRRSSIKLLFIIGYMDWQCKVIFWENGASYNAPSPNNAVNRNFGPSFMCRDQTKGSGNIKMYRSVMTLKIAVTDPPTLLGRQ